MRTKGIYFNLSLAVVVWTAWAVLGGRSAVEHVQSDWRVAVTMVFGSLVGGGTSEGGGAIAFPIFTKLLHISAANARNFSLAIQSVGMGAASLSILFLRIPIERRALLYAGVPGIAGVVFGALFVAPFVSPVIVRVSFTVLVSSLGLAVLIVNRDGHTGRNLACPVFGTQEKALLAAAGFAGGVVSALVGTGENSVVFMLMVLLFRISEKIVTPTTVILMTMVTIPGFLLHILVLQDFNSTVTGYWLAAVPVVVVGAPLGALICSFMPRQAIVSVLLILISMEFVSTILLVPMSRVVLWTSVLSLGVCGSVAWAMSRCEYYLPERFSSQTETGTGEIGETGSFGSS